MPPNFFTDNPDLVHHLATIDLAEVVDGLEDGYRHADEFPGAPRHYADAVDNYRRLLTLFGEVCATFVAPRAAEAADEGAHLSDGHVEYAAATRDALAVFRQAEVMGALLPREYGGLNLPESIYQMMIEINSRAEPGLMSVFGLQEISATLADFGEPETRARILPRFARGEVTGAMVLTEADAGSDLGAVQMRATLDEGSGTWRLSGVKRFITNGNADVLLVLARSEAGSTDARGLSMFLVEADETLRVRRLEHKMGLLASPTCEIEFRDTPARLVGKRRFGLIRYAMAMMNGARIAVAAQALGIAEAACREAEKYAAERIQFGQPIEAIPAVYRMLLAMRCEIEATRALLYEAGRWVDLKRALDRRMEGGAATVEDRARAKQADRLAGVLTPLVKYHATEMGNRVCYQALQVHGGAGYMREFPVERHFRDMRVTTIYEGTSQLQIVAATGPLLGRVLDDLIAEWSAEEYGADLAPLKARLDEATGWLGAGVDRLSGADRTVVDYYAADLVDLAVHLVTCWLTLRQARFSPRKAEVARVYVADTLPKMRAWSARLEGLDPAPIEGRGVVLGG